MTTSPNTEYTPIPWGISPSDKYAIEVGDFTISTMNQADAAFIVRAVNAFDAMREALERIVTDDKQGACDLRHDARMMADAALALANGDAT